MMRTTMRMMTMMMKAMRTVMEIPFGMMLLRLRARAENNTSLHHNDSSPSRGKLLEKQTELLKIAIFVKKG